MKIKLKPVGVLIDKIVNAEHKKDYLNCDVATDVKTYIVRPKLNGKRWPLMKIVNRFRGCWRVLADKGLVVYYKEDEYY